MGINCLIKKAALLLLCCALFGCTAEEEKLGTIYGTVTDYATGEPVGNANVKLRPNGETTLTGSDGTFEFVDLAAGKYSLLITKAQYADLDDDYIIELDAGKEVKRDVQLRKRVASLKIVDMNGNALDTLDFGAEESVRVKTFNVFNDGTETLTCTATYDCEWITNVSGLENQVESGQTVPVTVKIDRVALADGDNTTFLYITSANGSNELVVKASFLGQPVIKTKEATEVTSNSATLAGQITDDGGRPVLARGICYGTSQSPDINGEHTEDGSGTGEFNHNITGLSVDTKYYARAYATNRNGTYYASNIVSFTTTSGLPIVTTAAVTNITSTTAKSGGEVTGNGGYNVTARGVCWNTMGSPDLNDQHTTNGSGNGVFTANLTELETNKTYYVRAYATNQSGTSYGNEITFNTTSGLPVVDTKDITNVTPLSANGGGTVTSDNGFTVTERGVCWSTVSNPTINDEHSTNGSGTGEFNSAISGLQNSTTYHVRAYATNSKGTGYGEDKTFTTTLGAITVTTNSVINIGATNATCGGNATVTPDNDLSITAKGVCWSTSHNPVVSGNHTIDGTGVGPFVSSITGLTVNTTYYVRAYATNQIGTYYGDERVFLTNNGYATVVLDVNSFAVVSSTSLNCISNVSSDGGFAVTARGVCWGTVPNPSIANNHTNEGGGIGYYTSVMNGLDPNTTYYVRSYATNSVGTSYSEQFVLTTEYREYLSLPRMVYNGYTYVIHPDLGIMDWNTANNSCNNLSFAGFDDWYLPDKDELYMMYVNRDEIGGFVTESPQYPYSQYPNCYWSSTVYQNNASKRWYVDFETGVINGASIEQWQYVGNWYYYMFGTRPIRKEN